MKIKTALKKVKKKGIKGTLRYCAKKMHLIDGIDKKYKILLLTNRDSDNIGDQVIEACDIALISAVMKNLNLDEEQFEIMSRAASIVTQKYISVKDPELLKTAQKLIEKSDIVVFGGAPLFNYHYQTFYERTAVTLEIAQELGKPVIFSAIGVEGYDEKNKKCQRLKKTLNFDCVKQITTRDDYDSLIKYKDNENVIMDRVSDPAVFAAQIFRDSIKAGKVRLKKKIGIFVLRANGFKDNKINFSREDAAKLWVSLIRELEEKGYNYELLTSGHFGDEAFLDYLIRNYGVDANKCVFNMNMPEALIRKISSYDAVVSCRLHPSIISFSLDVPSLGIAWNPKVKGFYGSMGYEERVIGTKGINAAGIVEKLEQIMEQGIEKDKEYLNSIYTSLFSAIGKIVYPEGCQIVPYGYEELVNNIPAYKGTSPDEFEEKLKRKFRRAYNTYNERFDKIETLKEENKQLKEEVKQLKDSLKKG